MFSARTLHMTRDDEQPNWRNLRKIEKEKKLKYTTSESIAAEEAAQRMICENE